MDSPLLIKSKAFALEVIKVCNIGFKNYDHTVFMFSPLAFDRTELLTVFGF